MNGPRIGVHDELGWIEAQTELRTIRAIDTIAVDLTWPQTRNIAVPDVAGTFRQSDALGLVGIVGAVEEAELDRGGVLGEQGEIDARAVPKGAKRERRAGPGPGTSRRIVNAATSIRVPKCSCHGELNPVNADSRRWRGENTA